MEVELTSGEAFVVAEGDAFLGRKPMSRCSDEERPCYFVAEGGKRRSARCLGKERPCYILGKQSPMAKKTAVSKKPKLSPSKKAPKIPRLNLEPDVLAIQSESSGACGEEVKIGGCIKPEDGTLTGVFSSVENKTKASTAVSGSVQLIGNGADPQKGPAKSDKQRVKETLRIFNTYYLQLIQEEEKRAKDVVERRSKGSKQKEEENQAKDVAERRSEGSVQKEEENQAEDVVERHSKGSQQKVERRSKGAKQKNGAKADGDLKRPSKRPDLKAISKIIENKQVLYPEKRIGHLPGISIGDQFFSRAEMCVLGLHHHWLNGIDYMGQTFARKEEYKGYTFPLAVCIMLSGMYEDDLDNSEDIVYTGQGGHDLLGTKQQVSDQKLERGNLALKNNAETGVPVRVVRGHESKSSYCGRVYTYDGLYKVVKYWAEKGVSGFTVYKYKLRRVDGQSVLTTNQVQFTRAKAPQSISELRGLVCEDISGGQENFPIPATNVVDNPPCSPTDFEYCKTIRLSKNLKLPAKAIGCKCKGDCIDSRTCSCAKLNGGDFPYVRKDGGRLIEAKAVVFECGPSCGCSGSCVNRTSQQGLRYRLEVFRTPSKGWAVRSWDTIPSGAPVCEYTGILSRTDDIDTDLENNYIFDIDCLQTMKGLDGRERRPGDVEVMANLDDKTDAEFCIDAGRFGSVARFINHSCEPNLFVQCVLSTHHDIKMAKIMLFAADTIPPLQELCYDYGYALNSVVRPDGSIVELSCYCGAAGCRKRLY